MKNVLNKSNIKGSYVPIVSFVCFPVFKNKMKNQVVKSASKSSNEKLAVTNQI